MSAIEDFLDMKNTNFSAFNKADLAFHFLQTLSINIGKYRDWLIDWCLMPTLAIFPLYLGVGSYRENVLLLTLNI